jgi:hypothetical protein
MRDARHHREAQPRHRLTEARVGGLRHGPSERLDERSRSPEALRQSVARFSAVLTINGNDWAETGSGGADEPPRGR